MSIKLAFAAVFALMLALFSPEARGAVLEGLRLEEGDRPVTFRALPAIVSAKPSEELVGARADAVSAAVHSALTVLGDQVEVRSHPDALRYAFQAYHNYRSAHPERVRKPYLYYVDFGLDSRTPRGYVFDMDALRVVEGPFTVAHGRGSVQAGSVVPTLFSNRNGSKATSLGLYLAQETYGFRGNSAGRSYRSVGLRLQGLSGRFNSAARARGIVVHGAPYVTAESAGRSEGCPAMAQFLADLLLPRLANGGMVFHFSPMDPDWLREDPWVNGRALASAN
jgi:hypothetical protein